MTELICDICGTTYPDTDEKCPTCGYSRGLTVFTPYDGQEHTTREKVRGGRFSKKNVAKRLLERSEAEQAAAHVEMVEPVPEAAKENEEVRAVQDLAAQMSAAVAALNGEEAPAKVETPEEPAAPDQAEPAAEIAEEVAAVMVEAVEEVPGEPAAEEEPGETAAEAPEAEPAGEAAEAVQPEEPVSEVPEEPEERKQAAALAAYRRDVRMNLLLFFASVVFLLSSAYLVVTYGIPYLKNMPRPVQVVTEAPTEAPTEAVTEMPTEAPTQAPTEAPTEAPTQAPTEAPTQAPTEAPTEEPTVVLTTPLTLNYYDLTFRGANQGVQLEVAGYNAADLTWTSDDPAVATVSDTGKVISVGSGTTKIHASFGGHSVSCTVTCNFS